MSLDLAVQYASQLSSLPDEGAIHAWVTAALLAEKNIELVVRIVDEPEITQLNLKYRGKNSATNVLAFPADVAVEQGQHLLGDVVICAPVVVAQARTQGKSAEAHWAHLVVHGILHLQGYNHENATDAAAMESLEVDIMARLGYSNPYEVVETAANNARR